jgi:enamine deaminase RidA (YjgF/YER057c/UK114 family)/chorismate mutase
MSLEDVRGEIDRLDDQIIALLAQRQQQVIRAAEYKSSPAQVRAPQRRVQMMRRLRDQASALGVDPEVVTQVYTAMIDAFIKLEHREHHALTQASPVPPATGRRQQISSGSPYEPTIGFSRAIRSGNRVLVSGTGPVWPDGSCPDDADAQARRCFEIIGQALAAAGAGWGDVVRTRMFLTDPAAADQVSAVHGELFAETRPAATMVIVAGLLDPRWKVEIEAEADPQI